MKERRSFRLTSYSRADELGSSNFNTSICQLLCFTFETRFLLGAVLLSAGTCGPVLTMTEEKPYVVNLVELLITPASPTRFVVLRSHNEPNFESSTI